MKPATKLRTIGAVLAALALVATACGRSASTAPTSGTSSESVALATTTPPGTQEVDSITWGVYRETSTMDPIYVFDYPDNTATSLACETLLHQNPDGSITDGLASLEYPDDTTMVFTLKDGITFWDGNPLTPDDVVYDLERNMNPDLGGFYGGAFDRVKSIKATGSNEVTIELTKPDYWLAGELASTPGWIAEKAFIEEKGADFGTSAGGTMCTGSYELTKWEPGEGLTFTRNDNYWNPDVHPLVKEIHLIGAPDEAALTSALLTGDIDGYYAFGLSTLNQLTSSDAVTVTEGAGWNSDAFIVSSFDGPLGDVKVRQALSLALDRQGMIDTTYKGSAILPKAFTGEGTWGYGRDVFQQAWDDLPDVTQDIDTAKQMIQDAGVAGQTITLGMSQELANIATAASAYQSAAEAIGLKVKLKPVSAANYINFFIDPKAREGVDGFFTVNYGDYADPAALIATFVLPNGSQNYAGYSNDEAVSALEEARSTADPDARAALVAKAQAIVMEELPWIPNALPNSDLVTNADLSGATASFAYMFAPWANDLGGVG